ncbi:MAG: calcium/sodium antiporter [Planctomycetota bacterium]|nr:MAG: calcium/sodium antiporter [Planctomycetota bacterium]
MNIIWACLLLLGGLLILWKCADFLVSGAVALARQLGVSPLVVGLTVVAMGTSAPEVAASIAAAVRGVGDVAIGNVYGSNIANLALVGGIAALIRPIRVQLRTLQREIPVMILVALLLWPVLHNLFLSRPEGLVLLVIFAALILLTVYMARKDAVNSSRSECNTQYAIRTTKKSVLFIVIGLAGLALGADMAVRGAVFVGERIGLSNAVIGLTIIAIGTSLPELATCIAASVKGQHDISIGNLVGSNVFNTLLVVGTAGTIKPFEIGHRLIATDYWIMIVVSVVFAAAALIGRRIIGRVAGTLLLCVYIAYMVYLLAYTRAM